MDVLRHIVAANAQIRTMLSYFYRNRNSRARVNVEMKGEEPSDSFVWKLSYFFFKFLIRINEQIWTHLESFCSLCPLLPDRIVNDFRCNQTT